jgi:hypothetical protein
MPKLESGDFRDPSPRWANAENAGGAISIVLPAAVRSKKDISQPTWNTAKVVVCVPEFVQEKQLCWSGKRINHGSQRGPSG